MLLTQIPSPSPLSQTTSIIPFFFPPNSFLTAISFLFTCCKLSFPDCKRDGRKKEAGCEEGERK
jgi:hypothetical protein